MLGDSRLQRDFWFRCTGKQCVSAISYHNCNQRGDFKALRSGGVRLLYVSPERLVNSKSKAGSSLQRVLDEHYGTGLLQLIVFDECHCISQWGRSFRPLYTRMGLLRELWPRVPVLALTASATPAIEADIRNVLRLRQPVTLRASLHRTKLHIDVRGAASSSVRVAEIAVLCQMLDKSQHSGGVKPP